MSKRADGMEKTPLSRDIIFQILSNRRRRYAIHYLRRNEGPVEIGELATQIAAWENDVTVEEVTSQQRKRVYNTLQQAHLPKLDETGFIDYDAAHGDVTLTEQAEPLNTYLEIIPDNNLPWSEYYFVLGCISLALLTGAWFDAGPLGLVPDIGWAVGLAALVTVSGATHMYYYRNLRLGHTEVPKDE
ncbi:hypothetical protein BG842_07135 [Haladaptatus sp. W1]|uniref:DUF7344 domain-containing protein n=1 Tax=Haladaptatus sp. W1 TaxID=1897478 RepID=UPI0008497BB5|nr:hypothetical protein [Haladaptatus sp. W1]ODR79800.1 hypothetical protein BG842_07135 [Haladaptatus sp. W1]